MPDTELNQLRQDVNRLSDLVGSCATRLAAIDSAFSQQTRRTLDEENLTELRLKYAYDYFSFHAKQRTTMFNFFMVAVGLIVTAVATGIKDGFPKGVLIVLLGIGGLLSLAFLLLDKRNVQLLEAGEDVLRKIEENLFNWQESAYSSEDVRSFSALQTIPSAILLRERLEDDMADRDNPPQNRTFRKRTRRWMRHSRLIPAIQGLIAVGFLSGVVVACNYDITQKPIEVSAVQFLADPKVTVTLQNQTSLPSKGEMPPKHGTDGKTYDCSQSKIVDLNNFLPRDPSVPSDAFKKLSEVLGFASSCPDHKIEIRSWMGQEANPVEGRRLSEQRGENIKNHLINSDAKIKGENIKEVYEPDLKPAWHVQILIRAASRQESGSAK